MMDQRPPAHTYQSMNQQFTHQSPENETFMMNSRAQSVHEGTDSFRINPLTLDSRAVRALRQKKKGRNEKGGNFITDVINRSNPAAC